MKTINQKELVELLSNGAELKSDYMTDQQQVILNSIAAVKEENLSAEDIRTLKELMVQLVLQASPPVTYQFSVERDSRDRLVGITAKPQKLTRVRH